MNDPIGDMLTRIRNAQMRRKSVVQSPHPNYAAGCSMFWQMRDIFVGMKKPRARAGHAALEISLKYYEGDPVIRELKRVSKPGRRVYLGVKDIPQVRQGLGISIVSTPKGVMSDAAARSANVGGEVLCTVF